MSGVIGTHKLVQTLNVYFSPIKFLPVFYFLDHTALTEFR